MAGAGWFALMTYVVRVSDRGRVAWRAIFLGLLLCSAGAGSEVAQTPEAAPRVAILCSPYRSYREAADALQGVLESRGHACTLITLPKDGDKENRAKAIQSLIETKAAVIVTSGPNATMLALSAVPETPVVFFMVHNALDAEFLSSDSPHRQRVAGVAADVSPKDWLDWIGRLDPGASRLGILRSPRTRRTVGAIESEAQKRGVECAIVDVEDQDFIEALEKLGKADPSGVLMTLDTKVYNSTTVEHLLVWGIRTSTPIWAFSAGIVKAGAFAGLFPDGKEVGRLTAATVQEILRGTPPSKIGARYPRKVIRAVNDRTAGMIEKPVSDKAVDETTLRSGDKP